MVPSRTNTIMLAIIACVLWSTAFVGVKIGLRYTTPLSFAGIRFFIAGLLLLPFVGSPKTSFATVKKHFRFILKTSIFSTVLVYGFFYFGINLGSASTTAIVVGSGPLFVAVMAHFIIKSDKLTVKKAAALILGFVGIVIIAMGRYSGSWVKSPSFISVLLLIGANLCGSYGNILIAQSRHRITPLLLSSAQLTVGGAILFIISLFFESPDFSLKPLPYYGALAYLSFLSAAAMTIWFVLLKRPGVKVSEINIWKFLIPVFGAILSWILLANDKPEASAVIGMCCIAGALVIIFVSPRTRASLPKS